MTDPFGVDELAVDDVADGQLVDRDAPSEPDTGAAPAPAETAAEEPQPRFSSVVEFVEQWLAPMLRRRVNTKLGGADDLHWCPRWWAHEEVVDRLSATWRAWEGARIAPDPGAMAGWWLSVLDPMMAAITDRYTGPFAVCRDGHADVIAPLPLEPYTADAAAQITNAYETADAEVAYDPATGEIRNEEQS
ncbi:DUF4913 domain-containing protein [Nocardioides panzhihuensis]|uniref:DUF4913 domain-containing protein n=1 Tax=Nocardioides panzhihuensis TaxID=860243 RepID=A0A7Z0IVL6_9ACTN|nr:hypothetical protein [Nocardioides panzhihuensis]